MSTSLQEAWKKRFSKDRKKREERRKQARQEAESCAQILMEEFGADQVYLIGSVLNEERFYKNSDIDLVVRGLDPEQYISALSACKKRLPEGIDLDLIQMERAEASLQEKTLQTGERIK